MGDLRNTICPDCGKSHGSLEDCRDYILAPEPIKLPVAVTCECPISYHVESHGRRMVAVWDQEPPTLMEMCFGRCPRCSLPYHTEFTRDEPV